MNLSSQQYQSPTLTDKQAAQTKDWVTQWLDYHLKGVPEEELRDAILKLRRMTTQCVGDIMLTIKQEGGDWRVDGNCVQPVLQADCDRRLKELAPTPET